LAGTEIKSIRLGKANITESFANSVVLNFCYKHLYRRIYFWKSIQSQRSERKLLLNKKELKVYRSVQAKGLTIIPLKLFTNEKEWQN
jgi:SsrA-binding protein